MTVCVTGATGFVGAHVVRELVESGAPVRATYRDEARLNRLGGAEVEPVPADALDKPALRRAFRGCELVFHVTGMVGSRPRARVWELNALAPRVAVEAAAAEGVRRVVVTSSVAAVGPIPAGETGDEQSLYRGGGLGLVYVDAKHEGEVEALAAGARLGVEVVVVNPSYVLGPPVLRSEPGETSARTIANYLRGRLPAVVDAPNDFVDARDVARGHVLAAEKGKPGERYILGGHSLTWPELIARVAELADVHNPVAVLPRALGGVLRRSDALRRASGINEGIVLMAQNWTYTSRKAKRELGYRPRPLARTLEDTVDWCMELIESGRLGGARPSSMSVMAASLRAAERTGALAPVRLAERWSGRRLVVRP
jgi:dihydroflavonol-4-reductase